LDNKAKISLKIDPRKILIVKPSSLGDVIHSLPFLNAVKTCFPKSEIHWIIAKGLEGILESHPMINKLWVIDKDSWKNIQNVKSTIQEIKVLFKKLKQEKYDLVVDLQGLLRSGVITGATGAPVRIGFREAREGSSVFYTHKVAGGKNIHAVDRYLKIAESLGCNTTDISFPFPFVQSSDFRLQTSDTGDYAVIVPGARWKTKIWPAEKFGKLASLLPLESIIVGSKTDKAIADEIVSLSGGRALSLAGKTNLRELIAVISRANFIVSNDSGPMHIAAALNVPVFAIFGPTDPSRTGPYGKGHTIIREDILCSPCFRKSCDDMKCMKDLSVEKVYGIIKSAQKL
jgi:lipopolysaccharide heptosyltransferase I